MKRMRKCLPYVSEGMCKVSEHNTPREENEYALRTCMHFAWSQSLFFSQSTLKQCISKEKHVFFSRKRYSYSKNYWNTHPDTFLQTCKTFYMLHSRSRVLGSSRQEFNVIVISDHLSSIWLIHADNIELSTFPVEKYDEVIVIHDKFDYASKQTQSAASKLKALNTVDTQCAWFTLWACLPA